MSNCAWLNAWRRKGNEILLLPAWAHVTGTSPPPWESLKELSSWVCCPQDPELQTPLLPDLFVQWPSTVFLILSLDKFLLLGRVSSIGILMPTATAWACAEDAPSYWVFQKWRESILSPSQFFTSSTFYGGQRQTLKLSSLLFQSRSLEEIDKSSTMFYIQAVCPGLCLLHN